MTKETHVWIAQCLCQQRHCVVAAANEAESVEVAQAIVLLPLQEQVAEAIAAQVLNPWCGLCHAPASGWKFEVRRTRFASMDEAEPALRQLEAEQIITAAIWGDEAQS